MAYMECLGIDDVFSLKGFIHVEHRHALMASRTSGL